jgi:ribosome-associated protein
MKKASSRTSAAGRRLPAQVRRAVAAVRDRQAVDPVVLDLRPAQGFTDYFVICSGQNPRQIKAIADTVQRVLEEVHVKPAHVEGYDRADWVLLDYFDFIVHVFNPETRAFYALERLWGSAEPVDLSDEKRPADAPEPR